MGTTRKPRSESLRPGGKVSLVDDIGLYVL
jgi:hypothetical protein